MKKIIKPKGTGPKIGQKSGPITPKPKRGTRSVKKRNAIADAQK